MILLLYIVIMVYNMSPHIYIHIYVHGVIYMEYVCMYIYSTITLIYGYKLYYCIHVNCTVEPPVLS